MLYPPLGQTGLKISVLSFGASPLGGVFHPMMLGDCIETDHSGTPRRAVFIRCS